MNLIRLLLSCCLMISLSAPAFGISLEEAVNGSWRTEAFKTRDAHRHPLETLRFFEVEPQQAVAEIWPGNGWYLEILAPLLKDNGKYIAASVGFGDGEAAAYRNRLHQNLLDKIAGNGELYGATQVTLLLPPAEVNLAPAGSVDRVLTFRNVHNWVQAGNADAMFAAFHLALKSGGVLGVVEHRAKPGTTLDDMIKSGYVTEDLVIEMAERAGFELLERSEINANPKDTKDHPAGVWTLPPTLRLKEQDQEKYLAIGESDRMTLKFRKR